jgi:hypothetical protein
VPQSQTVPGVYPGETEHSGYIYHEAEVAFQGLGSVEKSGFDVAGYLYRVSYIPCYIPRSYLL